MRKTNEQDNVISPNFVTKIIAMYLPVDFTDSFEHCINKHALD